MFQHTTNDALYKTCEATGIVQNTWHLATSALHAHENGHSKSDTRSRLIHSCVVSGKLGAGATAAPCISARGRSCIGVARREPGRTSSSSGQRSTMEAIFQRDERDDCHKGREVRRNLLLQGERAPPTFCVCIMCACLPAPYNRTFRRGCSAGLGNSFGPCCALRYFSSDILACSWLYLS